MRRADSAVSGAGGVCVAFVMACSTSWRCPTDRAWQVCPTTVTAPPATPA
ncbi:MAG: hypothetical protein ABF502_13300 [Acetobacter sp.]